MRRQHGVDPDHVRSQFDGERPHQSDHAVFGSDVVTDMRISLVTGHRRRQDDRTAAAAGQQMRHPGLDRLPHAAEVDINHLLPQRFFRLVQLARGGADPRVRHDDVEAAQLFDAAVHGGLQRGEVPHVHLRGHDTAPGVFDHARGEVQIFRCGTGCGRIGEVPANVDGDDVCALARQPDRVTSALPARGATDECDLAVHPAHAASTDSLGDRSN